jgi:AraC-like DNA-binding protein
MHAIQPTPIPAQRSAQSAVSSAVNPRLVSSSAAPACLDSEGMRRIQFGQMGVDLRRFSHQRCVQLEPNATTIHVVAPLTGGVVAVSDGETHQVRVGSALLLSRRQRADCFWSADSLALVLDIPMTLLQKAIADSFPEPRRLAAVNHAFALDGRAAPLAAMLFALRDMIASGPSAVVTGAETDRQLADALVEGLKMDDGASLFAISRSLQRAADYLRAHPESRCSAGDLASIAGVTLPTLQRNVKTCLGVSLARFVEQVRLTWIYERLQSAEESRSIAHLAAAAGYQSSDSLTRGYKRLFDETPTRTRARAFAATSR